jgi:hypothetical protein
MGMEKAEGSYANSAEPRATASGPALYADFRSVR